MVCNCIKSDVGKPTNQTGVLTLFNRHVSHIVSSRHALRPVATGVLIIFKYLHRGVQQPYCSCHSPIVLFIALYCSSKGHF